MKNFFQDDWKKGGALHASCVKDPLAAPLQSLVRQERLQVSPLRVSKGKPAKFHVEFPEKVQLGSVWIFSKSAATVVHVHENVVVLDRGTAVDMYKRSILQKSWVTDPDWIFSQLKEFWDKYWNCPDGVMLDKVSYPVDSIPALPPLDCSVSSNDVLEAIKDLPVKKARGMDGWPSAELNLLSKEDTEVLASLYNSVPETGESPIQLCQAAVTLLAKVENLESPKDGRPITVLPVLYRLFAKNYGQDLFPHWRGVLPPSLFGSVSGRSSIELPGN